MILSEKQLEELKKVSAPLVEFLNSVDFHPHIKVIVTSTDVEILESSALVKNTDYIKD